MAETAPQTVLRRKVEARRAAGAPGRRPLPARGLSLALAKAADSAIGMVLTSESCSERIVSLAELLERLPENGLFAVLAGPGDGQGLMALDGAFLSALIEKQMTGSVSPSPPPLRRATRTDAALAADFIDATLHEFELSLAGQDESRWAAGFGCSSHVEDVRPLGLLLEDIDYRVFSARLGLEAGLRTGEVVLALPAEGRGRTVPANRPDVVDAANADPGWCQGFGSLVLDGEVRLEAVLHRFRLPISAISGLRPGDEIAVPLSAINDVRLTGAEHIPFGRCRLGQSQGHRALRVGVDAAATESPAAPFPRVLEARIKADVGVESTPPPGVRGGRAAPGPDGTDASADSATDLSARTGEEDVPDPG